MTTINFFRSPFSFRITYPVCSGCLCVLFLFYPDYLQTLAHNRKIRDLIQIDFWSKHYILILSCFFFIGLRPFKMMPMYVWAIRNNNKHSVCDRLTNNWKMLETREKKIMSHKMRLRTLFSKRIIFLFILFAIFYSSLLYTFFCDPSIKSNKICWDLNAFIQCMRKFFSRPCVFVCSLHTIWL